MATVAVTFQGTRVNASDANTNWSKLNVGGGAPAAEGANKYQGTNVVGNLIKTTLGGIEYDPAAGAVDMTQANRQLWFVKCIVTDSADLVVATGALVYMGDSSTANYEWVVAGTTANRGRFNAWPAQGGYLIFGLNPEVTAWRETTNGSPDLTAVDYFAFVAVLQNGFAKSENVGLDAIDIGTGLLLLGGDGADPDGDYEDFVASDQDTVNNRWGVVVQPLGSGSPITVNGRLDIGSSTAVVFTSSGETLIYPDGYHGAGDVGVLVDLQNASSVHTDGSTHIGLGSSTTEDTRPDYVFTGTSGSATFSGALVNFRNVTLTSVVLVQGAEIGCALLTQSSAEIEDSIILTDSAASVACLQDPTFGTTTGLHDTEFIQNGAGHALEIDTAGTYDFENLTFTGYNASNGQTDSAIFVNLASGSVTINVNGGNSPSYRLPGGSTATVTIVAGAVTLTVSCKDQGTGAAIEGAAVTVAAAANTAFPYQESVTITRSGSTATVSHTAHGLETGNKVLIQGADQNEYNRIKTITVTGANAYTFEVSGTPTTPATGTITATAVLIDGLTNASGLISDTRVYSVDQVVEGYAAKGTTSPIYKRSPLGGTVDKDNGVTLTAFLVRDE